MIKHRRKWLIGLTLAAVIAGLIFVAVRLTARESGDPLSRYQTQPVERGYLAETIGQSGNLRARQAGTLTWKTSGKVGQVLVETGDSVQTGDVLARLDPADLPVAILQAQSDISQAERDFEALQTSTTARAQAEAALVTAQKEVQDAEDAVALLDAPNASPANIQAAQAAVDLAKAQLDQAEQFYAFFEGQPEDDVTRLQAAAQVERARTQLRNAEWNLTFAQSKPNAAARAREQARLELARATLADAQRAWERLKDGPDEDDLAAAQTRIEAARATLATQEITAPFSGIVLNIAIQPGDLVQPAQPAFDLFDTSEYYVEIPVPEVDINRVKTGQTASLTFDAIKGRAYLGVVSAVGTAGTPSLTGVTSFTVEVRLLDPDGLLRPGLTAAVTIVTSQAEDTLLVPNRAIRLVRNQRVVYILRDAQPVQIPIVIGISDQTNTQVVFGDLKSGDTLILNPSSILTPQP